MSRVSITEAQTSGSVGDRRAEERLGESRRRQLPRLGRRTEEVKEILRGDCQPSIGTPNKCSAMDEDENCRRHGPGRGRRARAVVVVGLGLGAASRNLWPTVTMQDLRRRGNQKRTLEATDILAAGGFSPQKACPCRRHSGCERVRVKVRRCCLAAHDPQIRTMGCRGRKGWWVLGRGN